jgi:uncharacterized membrane protein YhaH (DUF805 family)
MLGFLFGFNARLGRMHYFLATIGLAVGMTAICFVIASYVFHINPRATASPGDLLQTWPVIAAMVFFGAMTFTLQSMRIRDIGWDPVCVVPAWGAIMMVDALVASKVPAWSLGPEHHGTPVGALVNLVLFLAMMFWPSGDVDSPTFGEPRGRSDKPSRSTDAAAERLARVTGGEFGRRAF